MAALRAGIRELRPLAITNVINSVSFYWAGEINGTNISSFNTDMDICKEKRDQKLVAIELYLFSLFLTAKIYADSGYTWV